MDFICLDLRISSLQSSHLFILTNVTGLARINNQGNELIVQNSILMKDPQVRACREQSGSSCVYACLIAGSDLVQRELIARAFAGDNVAAEFEAEKEAEAEKELPKIEAPSVLPGWGAWASNQKEPKWLAAAKLKVERYQTSVST